MSFASFDTKTLTRETLLKCALRFRFSSAISELKKKISINLSLHNLLQGFLWQFYITFADFRTSITGIRFTFDFFWSLSDNYIKPLYFECTNRNNNNQHLNKLTNRLPITSWSNGLNTQVRLWWLGLLFALSPNWLRYTRIWYCPA